MRYCQPVRSTAFQLTCMSILFSEPLLKTAATSVVEEGDDGKKNTDGPQYQRLAKEKQSLSTHPAVAVADCIHLPLRSNSCDAAICIAVMHHLSTAGRRIRCLSELRRIVKLGGLINVQAWALEQEVDSKRKFHGTDVLVPFNAQPKYLQASLSAKKEEKKEDEKYQAGVQQMVESSKGKGVAEMMAEKYDNAEFDSKKNLVVFKRYCHMYRKGELEYLCGLVGGFEVIESSYEKGNWGVVLRAI
jgi:SAM-dependent methyltransferase